ncbi:catalase [Lachnospiraceae bacterium MD329]|nr:catalase [Lachnospiraceae bacterium MD329]
MLHIIKHFLTITKHRHKVIYHCFKCGILWQGLRHDLSKYSMTEFIPGARYYLGDRSPTEAERRTIGYSAAWLHHKGRNKHHFEYWEDYNVVTRRTEPVEMPLKYVKEMFCDRVAAGKVYLGDKYTNDNPIGYFVNGNAKNIMHPNTARLLESWLLMLQREGEKKTFAYIKSLKADKAVMEDNYEKAQ